MDQNELTIAEIESLLFSNPSSNDGGQQHLSAEAFHQLVARRFATELTTFVGASVIVSVEPARHIAFGEFRLVAQRPACFQMATAEPEFANILLKLPSAATGMLLNQLLGSGGGGVSIDRLPATDLEQRLLNRVLAIFWKAFAHEWNAVTAFELSTQEVETDFGKIAFATADETVAISTFQLTIEQQSAELHCCLPVDWLRQLIVRRIAALQTGKHETRDKKSRQLVEVTAILAQLTMSPEEIEKFQVGDFIPTAKDISEPLDVLIDGVPTWRANLDAVDNHKAVRIVGEQTHPTDGGATSPGEEGPDEGT